MTILTAKAICAPLYNFSQLAFATDIKEIRAIPFSYQVAQQFFHSQNPARPIPIKDAIQLPISQKRVLFELLSQYIMFLTLNEDLPFPADFLLGTSDLQLGVPLLEYLVQHRFPFPQLLPQ